MTIVAALAQGAVVERAVEFAASPYPPSFDNSPLVFGWALFSRLLIAMLSMATIVRVVSRNRAEQVAWNHPVYMHRTTFAMLLWGALLGSAGDVITYLFWGEVPDLWISRLLLLARVMDGMTMFPFLAALFVPVWLGWLFAAGLISRKEQMTINGVVNDLRSTWDSKTVPLQLAAYSAVGAALVTALKYWMWLEHAHH